MELDHKLAATIAENYFGTPVPLKMLGWGISGFVYLSPDLATVVKVHRYEEGFARELEVYRRLDLLKINQLHGLTIPKLRDFRSDAKLIRMDFVLSPYLLDFAGVSFTPPDFSEDTMNDWHLRLEEMFGPNVDVAYHVYESLKQHGIYYLDFRPSNMKLDGLPGLKPFGSSDSESV